MKLLPFIIVAFLFSCHEKMETVAPPVPQDPWQYINRISDTLQETEFSLFNGFKKNEIILSKLKKNQLTFKYRIGQNRYVPVIASHIMDYKDIILTPNWYHINISVDFSRGLVGLNGHIYNVNDPFLEDSICKAYLNSLSSRTAHDLRVIYNLDVSNNSTQQKLLDTYDRIAGGYLKFLVKITLKEYNTNFLNLDSKVQNEIICKYPLLLRYDFYQIYWHTH